ncbi:site-2 protease family protein [Clostridium beijerinckii]|uniref:site-2 protease family protein n=1 Tax=Clostridium beijerinckii TaxID=1520 RepID=UPI00047B9CFA|nr:site-2 protease family protein [Clostridium beijerinckii]
MERFKKRIIIYVTAYITLCITTILHEMGHSIAAYFFKIKNNPFDIIYSTKLFMLGTSENVDYDKVSKLIKYKAVLISSAGLIVNFIVAVSLIILLIVFYKKFNKFIYFALYSFLFWNINEFFNYFVIRNIFLRGDVANIVTYGIPHILVLILGIGSSLILVYFLFSKVNKNLFRSFDLTIYQNINLSKKIALIFIICQVVTLYNALFSYS